MFMDSSNRNTPENNTIGSTIPWVIIFILMLVFWPVGLPLLILKLRDHAKPVKQKTIRKKDRNPLEKKSGKLISTVLLLISIALFVVGANSIAGALRNLPIIGFSGWAEIGLGAFYLIGGLIAFFSRNVVARRLSRYKNYYAFTTGHDIVPIHDIARAAGVSKKAVARDLQAMINNGYYGPGAYIDNELNSLVLSTDAAKAARNVMRGRHDTPAQPDTKPDNQYMALIVELREINATIVDIAISDKVDRIGELTGKIFRIVDENPEKLPQIRRFMNYYLPTTFKLLRSYSTLEKQGIKGENIMAAKENIGRILNTLTTGFEQQLDQLFQSDAINIAADITVLENLMQQDGLTGDRPELKTMEGV